MNLMHWPLVLYAKLENTNSFQTHVAHLQKLTTHPSIMQVPKTCTTLAPAVTPDTQETEIKRVPVQGEPGEKT
jgi:hypothetical protein